MKLSTALAFSALLALSSAMPLEKRQDITITTTIDILEIETVDVVVTVWLPPGAKPVDQNQNQQVAQPSTPNSAPVVHVTPVENAVVPAQTAPPVAQQNPPEAAQSQANQAQEKTNQAQAAKNQAAQEQSIQTQNQANQAQEQANDSKVAQNQAASAPNPPSPAVAVNTPAAAPVESSAVPPATQDSTSYDDTQQTSGGSCGQIGGSCTATNVTYFGGGMGACGWSNDTNSEDFFALAHGAHLPHPSLRVQKGRGKSLTLQPYRYDGNAIKWEPLLRSYSGHRVPRQNYPWNFDRQMHGLRKVLPLESGWCWN